MRGLSNVTDKKNRIDVSYLNSSTNVKIHFCSLPYGSSEGCKNKSRLWHGNRRGIRFGRIVIPKMAKLSFSAAHGHP